MTLAQLPPDQAAAVLRLAAVSLMGKRRGLGNPWTPYPHQVPPDGEDWAVWVMLGGRGSGKTDAGAHYVDAHARGPRCIPDGPAPHRIAIVAPSHEDAVDTCVRGESGLLQANRAVKFTPGASKTADLTWPNGAEAALFGAFTPEDVERFRGPQHCLVWADELAAWRKLDDVWDMMEFGLRLGPSPRIVATTTPKRRDKLKEILARPDTVVSRAGTNANPSLPAARRDALYARYGGTTLGRQELDAELIDDVAGALWNRAMIRHRSAPRIMRRGVAELDMVRIVVAIDPAVTSGEDSDETGIVIVGRGAPDGLYYVLDDLSGRLGPLDWAKRAVTAYHEMQADRIVAEANQGGDMVSTLIRQVDPNVPVTLVHASRAKRTRAEPVAALYEQGRVFHDHPLPLLEDQQCSFTGDIRDGSPDRMDALVWAMTDLGLVSSWQGASDVAVA